ncbi:MAG: hypothetical protein QOE06_2543 [Thermoleophilaceae bacterium]|nr:hypothetical protein [Thermoleophilaceae bacterium]
MRRLRLDRFELVTLAGLSALSVAVLAGLLVRVWTKGGVVTGSDGLLVTDQLQYLNWLRQAGDHLLVGNLYDLRPGPRSFLHPGVVISGLLHRAGLGVAASYLVWKPVAVGALFAAAVLYCRRFLYRPGDRRVALAIGLFGATPAAALAGWAGARHSGDFDFLARELWVGNYLWGYLFTAVAVAMVPLGLLAYERGRDGGPRRALAGAAAAGLLASWLQPWQGATFALILVAGELLASRRLRRELAAPLAATAAPLVYYLLLGRGDASWELAQRVNDIPRWPWWVTVAGLAPLAVPAALAYARPRRLDFGHAALYAWPPAALAVFYQPAGTFPFHALQGLTLPLAVLAVMGVRSWAGERRIPAVAAVAAAAALVVPGTIYLAGQMRDAVANGYQAHYLTTGERDALAYLDANPEAGGVLAPAYTGTVVPAYTGRETWVGAGSWTPHFPARRTAADRLFGGELAPAQARALVLGSGARFLLSDCAGRRDIERLVRGFTDPPRRFGCAVVYRVST